MINLNRLNLIKNIIVFSVAYIPPLIVFGRHWIEMKRNKILLMFISIIYVVLSIYTENIIPFIFVIFNINYMKFTKEFYYFNIREFKILEGLRMVAISYLTIIIISLAQNVIAVSFKINLNQQQEIVTYMSGMPLTKLVLMIPVVVLFAPILEEFVFRWLFFERIFKGRIGIYAGAILSSFIFSFIHFSLTVFPIILWIGIYNCYLIHKKGYWYAVFNHSVFNFVTMLGLFAQKLGEYKLM
ncbi:lysostaphin resistance A-like protein [Clostridium sp. LBM24168]